MASLARSLWSWALTTATTAVITLSVTNYGQAQADWTSFGDNVKSEPVIASWGGERFGVFVLDYEGVLWHTREKNWEAWESLGGRLTGKPSAVVRRDGSLDVFARGINNELWHLRHVGESWGEWESLGGVLTADPVAVVRDDVVIDVLIRGSDEALWWLEYDGTDKDFKRLQGELASTPKVISWGPGRLDVFAQFTDNTIWHRPYVDGWLSWVQLKGLQTDSELDAVSWEMGRIDLFARGTDQALWHSTLRADTWSPWESMGGNIASAPTAVSWAVGRLDVFARSTEDTLVHLSYSTGWSDWESLGGNVGSRPAAIALGRKRLEVVTRSNTSVISYNWYDGGRKL